MPWLFATIIVVSAGYLTHLIIALMNRLNSLRPRIEALNRQVEEQEAAWDRCEGITMETEHRVGYLEDEALKYEHRISDLQVRINHTQAFRQEKALNSAKARAVTRPKVEN